MRPVRLSKRMVCPAGRSVNIATYPTMAYLMRKATRWPLLKVALHPDHRGTVALIVAIFGTILAGIAALAGDWPIGAIVPVGCLLSLAIFLLIAFIHDQIVRLIASTPRKLQDRMHAFYFRWQGIHALAPESVLESAKTAFIKEWSPICAELIDALGDERFTERQAEPPQDWPARGTIRDAAERVTGITDTEKASQRIVLWAAALTNAKLSRRSGASFNGMVKDWLDGWAVIHKEPGEGEGFRTYRQPIEMVVNTFCQNGAKERIDYRPYAEPSHG